MEIREAVYQCAPFLGFPKTLNGVAVINGVFLERGIELPLPDQGTVIETDRFERGGAIQHPLYGDEIRDAYAGLPESLRGVVPRMLTEFCFGDFYTRSGLDLALRELLVLCMLAALGGADEQLRPHAAGNLKAGNTMEVQITALIHCLPYIGFPRPSTRSASSANSRHPCSQTVPSIRQVVVALAATCMVACGGDGGQVSLTDALVTGDDLPGEWEHFDAKSSISETDLCGEPRSRGAPEFSASTGWAIDPDDGPIFGERLEHFADRDHAAAVLGQSLDLPCTFTTEDGARWRTEINHPRRSATAGASISSPAWIAPTASATK